MNDFVTLNCPSCGGKLNVQKDSPTYFCEYCGTEHKLREEDVESFGRCPKCQRNDRVEKITAIVNRHDQLAAKFPIPDQIELDDFVERSDLVIDQERNSLLTTQIPENIFTKRGKYFFIGMVVLFLWSIRYGFNKETFLTSRLYFLLASILFAVLGVIFMSKGEKLQSEQKTELWNRRSVLEHELTLSRREVNNKLASLRRMLKSRYDQIYYCHRDDLLFIPGESGYSSCNDYHRFLMQGFKNTE